MSYSLCVRASKCVHFYFQNQSFHSLIKRKNKIKQKPFASFLKIAKITWLNSFFTGMTTQKAKKNHKNSAKYDNFYTFLKKWWPCHFKCVLKFKKKVCYIFGKIYASFLFLSDVFQQAKLCRTQMTGLQIELCW